MLKTNEWIILTEKEYYNSRMPAHLIPFPPFSDSIVQDRQSILIVRLVLQECRESRSDGTFKPPFSP